jgi:hypothetical protein
MSVRARTDDAKLLWENGRCEGAVLSALVAFAATSKRAYPTQGDRDAFEALFRDCFPGKIEVEFRGKLHRIETILYKWLRCELVHEGGLPVDVILLDEGPPGSIHIRAGGAPEFTLKLGAGFYRILLDIVVRHPVNAADFQRDK